MTQPNRRGLPRVSRRAAVLSLLVAAWAVVLAAQARIDPRLLTSKMNRADQQQAALAVPFTGVRTADGLVPGPLSHSRDRSFH